MTPVLTPRSHKNGGRKRLRRSARLRDMGAGDTTLCPPNSHMRQGMATIVSMSTTSSRNTGPQLLDSTFTRLDSRITPAAGGTVFPPHFQSLTDVTAGSESQLTRLGDSLFPTRAKRKYASEGGSTRRHSSRLFATNPYANWRLDSHLLTASLNKTLSGHSDDEMDSLLDPESDMDKANILALDQVSRALATQSSHHFSILAPDCPESFALSHEYKSNYGSDYFDSLLEREQLQLSMSQDRLNQSQLSSSSFDRTSPTTTSSVETKRMRTRSFGRELDPDRALNSIQKKITPRMRSTLVGWIIDVTTETNMRHETLHYCIQLLDRVLEEIPLTKHNFQCFGCSCLLIAGKLGEKKSPRAADIAFLTDSICNMRDITEAELEIVTTLEFNLQLVSAYNFIDRFLTASYISDNWNDISDTEKDNNRRTMHSFNTTSFTTNPRLEATLLFYLDMSLFDSSLVTKKRSLIAAAALYLAKTTVGLRDSNGEIWNEALVEYTGYELIEIDDVIIRLYNIHLNVLETKNEQNRAVVKKYSDAKYLRVSRKPPILRQDIFLPGKKRP